MGRNHKDIDEHNIHYKQIMADTSRPVQMAIPLEIAPHKAVIRSRSDEAKVLGLPLLEMLQREQDALYEKWANLGVSVREYWDLRLSAIDYNQKDSDVVALYKAGGLKALRERFAEESARPHKPPNYWYQHTVFFLNPHREPPGGKPRKLLEIISGDLKLSPRQQDKVDLIILRNPGYVQGLGFLEKTPPKIWSEERKTQHRINLMQKRMAKLYSIPELLEAAIQEKLASKPEYYGLVPLALPLSLPMSQAQGTELLPAESIFEAFDPNLA
jgi:hypothetical protein